MNQNVPDYGVVRISLLLLCMLSFLATLASIFIICCIRTRHTASDDATLSIQIRVMLQSIWGSESQARKINSMIKQVQEKRRSKLNVLLDNYKMVVEEKHLIDPCESYEINTDIDKRDDCCFDEDHDFVISIPNHPFDSEKGYHIASGACTICLAPYEVDDIIMWSPNEHCSHVFHQDCILSWLMRKKHSQCPCCRQNFSKNAKTISA